MQDNITFSEFIKIQRAKEVPVTNDMCFKYSFSNESLVKKLLIGLDYGIKSTDKVEIDTEVGVGTVGVKIGEKRFDLKVKNTTTEPNETYALEMQDYYADMEFKGFFKFLLKVTNSLEESKSYVTNISELEKNHVIIFDNCTSPSDGRLYTEIFCATRRDGMTKNFYENKYYDGEVIIFYLNNIMKSDKIKGSEDRSVEILKSLKYNSDELLESGDEFMKELGERVKAFNADELKREAAFEAMWEEINKRAIEKKVRSLEKSEEEARREIADANERAIKAEKETAQAREEIAQAKEKVIASAKEFKALGLPIEKIMDLTGLDKDTINNL